MLRNRPRGDTKLRLDNCGCPSLAAFGASARTLRSNLPGSYPHQQSWRGTRSQGPLPSAVRDPFARGPSPTVVLREKLHCVDLVHSGSTIERDFCGQLATSVCSAWGTATAPFSVCFGGANVPHESSWGWRRPGLELIVTAEPRSDGSEAPLPPLFPLHRCSPACRF
jgi:hypothetical protein